jgi:predicted nucleotidyltransferase
MSNKAGFGLSEKAMEQILAVLQCNPRIKRAIIYGSRALGTHKEASDIDLTLTGDQLTYDDLLSISMQLDDLLLPYKMDISLFHQIDNQHVVDHIVRHGREIYCA